MQKLYVMAELTIKPEMNQDAATVLFNLAATSLKDCGCESYQVLQSSEHSHVFTTLEIWASEQDESLHWETAHVKEAVSKLADMTLSPAVIRKYISI